MHQFADLDPPDILSTWTDTDLVLRRNSRMRTDAGPVL